MATLIPNINSCVGKMTSGERRLARRLEALLEEDYLCWFDIPLGSKRRYPDFIVLHPSRGILFLEVKDWKLASIKKMDHHEVELLTDSGLKTVTNPMEQARQCSYQVVNQLEKDPQLQQLAGKHKGKLCLPYGYGVVLSNITRQQWNVACDGNIAQETLMPSHLLLCKDEMTQSVDAEAFQSRLWDMFSYRFGDTLTLPQVDRVRWHLFPEMRIDHQQADLFGSDAEGEGDGPSVIEYMPDIVKIMDVQQEQLARSLGEGHRVIHGVAGSGKTLILGYRCLYLAEALNKPVLVLCFNITLASKLRSFIQERGIAHKVQVYHFHDWCGEQLRTYHVDLVASEAHVWERQVESVIAGVESGMIPKGQYGALLIDEGHDFEAEWLTLVAQMVDPDTNSLLLLYDDAQSIYKKQNKLNFSLSSVGIQAKGRTTILRLNYRNTREILNFAYRFAKEYFTQSEDTDIPLIEPQAAGKNGEDPVVKYFDNLSAEVAYVVRCLQVWNVKGMSWSDIAILYPGGTAGKLMAAALKKHNIPHCWLASSIYKKSYNPENDEVAILPIPSSKGLEFNTVVVLDSSYVPQHRDDSEHAQAECVRCLYVALTRAREHLLVSYHRENQLSKGFSVMVEEV